MKVERLEIADVILVTPPRFADSRGFFSETALLRKYWRGIHGVNLVW